MQRLFANPVTPDHKTQTNRESQFGRRRFLNASEQTSVCSQSYVTLCAYYNLS
jgi:hypothetical protein